jgi:hypothetical protein
MESKNFKPKEIIGRLPDGSLYLKMGVKRKKYNDSIDPEELESHINYDLINFQKAEKYYKYVEGAEDYERD